jgi:predicted MFS family arabinose efflux permease
MAKSGGASSGGAPSASGSFHSPLIGRTEAYLMLAGAALMLSVAMGIRQSFGLFQSPVVKDLGITVAQFSTAIAVQNLIWGLCGPIAGGLIDKYGTRWVSIGGVVLLALGLLVMSRANGALVIILGGGILVGMSQACTTVAVAGKIAAHVVVPHKRSLAFGMVSAAGSIGTFFAAPFGQAMIAGGGWRSGVLAFIGLAVLMLPAVWIGSRADKLAAATNSSGGAASARQSMSEAVGEALSHRGYVVMSLAYFVCGLQLTFITAHLPSYLELCGQNPSLGASALGTIGLFNVFGSWLFGWLGDKYRKRMLLGLVYLARAVVVTVYFITPVTPASTLIFAALMGMLWLSVIPLVNGLVLDIFGVKFLSTLMGIAFLSHQVGSFLGAWGGGFLFDRLGSYDAAVMFTVLIGFLAGCAQLLMDDKPTERMVAAKLQPAE